LGKHYKEIRYTIASAGTVGGKVGGTAGGGIVRLDERYSVGLNPPHDIHEMIHVFNARSGTLRSYTDHLWHGAIMDAVEARLGFSRPADRRVRVMEEIKRLTESIDGSANGNYSRDQLLQLRRRRQALLGLHLDLVYYEHGEKAIGRLYRSTINPHPLDKPSPGMVEIWGKEANKVQALLESLRKEYKVTFDERTRKACGF
jgi:hypothetical protein